MKYYQIIMAIPNDPNHLNYGIKICGKNVIEVMNKLNKDPFYGSKIDESCLCGSLTICEIRKEDYFHEKTIE